MKKFIWIIAIILMILSFIVQVAGLFSDPASITVSICYFICVLVTCIFIYIIKRRKAQPPRPKNIGFRFVLFGSLGAVAVETLFWFVEIIVGSEGVAAHPNIFVDLAVLMPWYISMITIFYFVNKKCGFSWKTTMLLGGLYEFVADGIVGHLLAGNPITLEYIFMIPIFFGVFVFVYFPMLAMPIRYYDIKATTDVVLPRYKRILYGLMPILALIPFTFVFLLIFAP